MASAQSAPLTFTVYGIAALAGAPIPAHHIQEVTAEQAAEVLAENPWINDESLSMAIEAKSKAARQAVDMLRDSIEKHIRLEEPSVDVLRRERSGFELPGGGS